MKYLLGVDFGGGSTKATLIDKTGKIIQENTVEYPTYYPNLGWCEQAPEDWDIALSQNISTILEKSGIDAGDVLAIAIDSATHTSLICDENFKPIRPAMHWTDTRSRAQADRVFAEMAEDIFNKTYHKPDTIWTLPQLMWLNENEKDNAYERHIEGEDLEILLKYWNGEYNNDGTHNMQ